MSITLNLMNPYWHSVQFEYRNLSEKQSCNQQKYLSFLFSYQVLCYFATVISCYYIVFLHGSFDIQLRITNNEQLNSQKFSAKWIFKRNTFYASIASIFHKTMYVQFSAKVFEVLRYSIVFFFFNLCFHSILSLMLF